MIIVESIQCGTVVTEGDPQSREVNSRRWTTAFYKNPVAGPVEMTSLGIHGDHVADTKHHGGVDKAVLCYAASHYAKWAIELPELGLSGGAFGENLTLSGIDETTACIGDRYSIGDCEIEISQPRQPCWKISRRWGVSTLTKQVAQTGRTGWYARVIRGGVIAAGNPMHLTKRIHPDWTIARANDVMFGRDTNKTFIEELKNLSELSPEWTKDLPALALPG